VASGDRRAALAKVRVPTLVVRGIDDPIVRLAGGQAAASAIPGARLVTFRGMGHDLLAELWPAICDEIRAVADQAGDHGRD
jgi:pimeloyl-ACP methyl ester carboxylesterase